MSLSCLTDNHSRASGKVRHGLTALGCALLITTATTHTQAAQQPVELTFAAEVAGLPYDCASTFDGIGRKKSSVEITDYRAYISDVVLHTSTGESAVVTLDVDGRW